MLFSPDSSVNPLFFYLKKKQRLQRIAVLAPENYYFYKNI